MKESLSISIEKIDLIEDEQERTKEIYRVLGVIDSHKMDDYQHYYLKGCLWNLMPFDNKERRDKVEKNLKQSIEINPDYIFSKTELSFFYYDEKKYFEVIQLLERIDFSFFEKRDQLWKSLKLQELLLSSKFYVMDVFDKKISEEYESLVYAYILLPEEDIAVPREIVNAVIDNLSKDGMLSIIKSTLSLISSKNQRIYFDNETKCKLDPRYR